MDFGERAALRWPRQRFWLVILAGFLAGCAGDRSYIERALLADRKAAQQRKDQDSYFLECPDVLLLAVSGHPEWSGRREIGPDGRIDLGNLGRLRVEGKTTAAAGRLLAGVLRFPEDSVHVEVADYRSQQISVIGQVAGEQRTVAYRGPETVLEVLQRAGGLTAGAEPDAVYVVRAHVAEGKKPEVYRVDLRSILFLDDARTNILIQPRDQIFVGERALFSFERCVAPWLRPVYEAVFGLWRSPS
jgi:protein involved in polysaccharide export with SLBB domain